MQLSRLNATYMIAGTIIGAGILALPVAIGSAGFLPGAFLIILLGIAATLTALYIAEAVLYTDEKLHLPALADKYLGKIGLILMFLGIMIYIYGALTGYLAAGGLLIFELSKGFIPIWLGTILYFIFGTVVVYLGLRAVGLVHLIQFSLVLILFFSIVGFSLPSLNLHLLARAEWANMPSAFGIILFAFVGHSIIPTVARGLKHDPKGLKYAAFFGVVIPLVLYIIWCFTIAGVVPYDGAGSIINPLLTNTLIGAQQNGQPATIPLGHIVGGTIIMLASLFAIFSTMNSYIGFGLSLTDSYIDFFKDCGRKISKLMAVALTVLLPLFFSITKPAGFLSALDIAGTYGGGLFTGILPVLIVLKARKSAKNKNFVTLGGTWLPILVFLLFLIGLLYKTYSFFI